MAAAQQHVQEQVEDLESIAATLDPNQGDQATRQQRFEGLQERLAASSDSVRRQMAVVTSAFLVGLFAGGDVTGLPTDNLDLERWCRRPKGHECRLHRHRHAGVRIVQEGPTLLLALDAHRNHPEAFTAQDLLPYHNAQEPIDQLQAIQRRKVMRKARSPKNGRPSSPSWSSATPAAVSVESSPC